MECLNKKRKFPLKAEAGGHFKALRFLWVSLFVFFFFHLAGGELKKSLRETRDGRKPPHLCERTRELHLRSPITIPASLGGEGVAKGRETKGGEKGKRKEEIEGEIYTQQSTGV